MAVKLLGDLSASGNATFNSEVNLPSGGQVDWANGDARIKEGLVTNYSLSFQTYTGSALTTKMFIQSGGNVGIGTTSPSSNLHVHGAGGSGVATQIKVTQADDGAGHPGAAAILQSSGWGEAFLKLSGHQISAAGGDFNVTSSTDLALQTNGTNTRMFIRSDGNIGIGTTAPLEKLHVAGKINSSNNIVSNSTYTMFTGRSSRTVDDYGGLNKEYFKANLVTPGPNTTGESSAHGIADLRFQLANSAGNTGMSDIMTLRSGGNVGIGTTTPSDKLHVVGNATIHSGANLGQLKVGRGDNQEIKIYVDDTNNIITAYQDSDSNSTHIFALDREFDGSGANNFFIRKGGSNQLGLDTSGNLRLYSYTAGLLKTDANGNVSLDTNTYSTATGVEDNADVTDATNVAAAGALMKAGGTMTGTLKLDSELQFLRGSTDYSNYIRAANYPSQNYTSSTAKYWIEYGAKGGHHFVVNTDGGAASAENAYDDFTIWQGAVDGDRLFEVTNVGNVTTAGKLYIGTTSATTTATTALLLGAAGEVKKRGLGSNAFSSTSFLPLAGGTVTGMTIFEDGMRIGTGSHYTDGRASITFGEGATTNDSMYIEYDGENLSGDNNAIIFGSAKEGVGDIFRVTYGGSVLVGSNAVATESYVGTAISNLVDSSPAALDTLNELAAALGNDASFSTTISTALGNRLRIDVNNQSLSSTELANARTNLGLGTAATAASTAFVAVSGDTMTGALVINEGASDQTNSADTTTLPSTTGAEFMRIEGTYTDGRYTTELAKVDRGGNLPLYIRQSKSSANSFVNLARFGDHSNSVHEFEVFGSIKATGGDSGNWNTSYTYSQVGHLPLAGGTLTGGLKITDASQGLLVDSAGHAGIRLDRGSTSYDNNILFYTAGSLKWRLWQDGSDDYLYIRDSVNSNNMVVFKKGGNVGIGASDPAAPLDVQPASDYKVTKVGDDRTSHYKFTGQSDHTLTLASGSYYSAEVVITAHQTNGGTNNNLYIRGIWTNNHTSHHWHEIENIGGLSGSSFTITNGQSGDTTNSGELEIVHDYTSGSFGQMVVRVTDHYGTHSYTIS